jgi:small subunit ribosomal protein S24e
MQINIKEKNENSLLNRTEVKGELVFEGASPSNEQLTTGLAKEFKADSSLIVIKNIYTKFSTQEADFLAFIYKNVEAKNKVEMTTKHMKKQMEEDKKKAAEAKAQEEESKKKEAEPAQEEAKVEEPVAETPKEEESEEPAPVEEKPAEEKKEGEQ